MRNTPDRNIYLVGFMGAGKSSVGRELAKILNRKFLDLDDLIEYREARSIREIFDTVGESRFREFETGALLEAAECENQIVALGGGAFMSDRNREICRKTGHTVWLDIPFETAQDRVGDDPARPLFAEETVAKRLHRDRLRDYRQAEIRMDASIDPPEKIAREIAEILVDSDKISQQKQIAAMSERSFE